MKKLNHEEMKEITGGTEGDLFNKERKDGPCDDGNDHTYDGYVRHMDGTWDCIHIPI